MGATKESASTGKPLPLPPDDVGAGPIGAPPLLPPDEPPALALGDTGVELGEPGCGELPAGIDAEGDATDDPATG